MLADVILLVYDSSDPNSFAYCAQLVKSLQFQIPCIFVATKSDMDLAPQVCFITSGIPTSPTFFAGRYP
jgi:GTPase SAR1 family protein